jgi:hypothetical protein
LFVFVGLLSGIADTQIASLLPEMKNNKAWGLQLRRFREHLGLSQGEFSNAVSQLLVALTVEEEARLTACDIGLPEALQGFELNRYEKGKRLPIHRSRHVFLVWVLHRLGAITSITEANTWLESGGQGYLTRTEQQMLFWSAQVHCATFHEIVISGSDFDMPLAKTYQSWHP